MNVVACILDGPLADPPPWSPDDGCGTVGAILTFEGVARGSEDGRPIIALDYEVYEPMATRELLRIGEAVVREFDLIGLYCEHSRGRVPVGRVSLRLRIAARHRAEVLRAAAAFIDRLKQDAPIWKRAVGAQA